MSMARKGPDRPDLRSGTFERGAHRAEMLEMRPEDLEMAAGDRGGNRIGSSLDAVGDELVARLAQRIHALDQHPVSAGALDACAHRRETEGEVAHFGIARRVEDRRFAFGEAGGHDGRLAGADRRR